MSDEQQSIKDIVVAGIKEPTSIVALGYFILGVIIISFFSLGYIGDFLVRAGFLLESWRKVLYLSFISSEFIGMILVWLFLRRLPRFSSKSVGILFALPINLKSDDEVIIEESRQLKSLYHDLEKRIQSIPQVKLKKCPHNRLPKNNNDVIFLKGKCGAALVISGVVDSGKFENQAVTDIQQISFTYTFHNLSPDANEFLSRVSAMYLLGKPRTIRHSNDLIDRRLYADNVSVVSQYILAVSLATKEKYKLAIDFFDKIYPPRKELASDLEKTFYKVVASNYSLALLFYVNSIGLEAYPCEEKKDRVIRLVERAETVDPDSVELSTQKAIIYFWKNDLASAYKVLKQAVTKDSKQYGSYFSLAFLNYFQGNIGDGWKNLVKALRKHDVAMFQNNQYGLAKYYAKKKLKYFKQIVKFYQDVLLKDPNKKFLLFPAGVVMVKYLNRRKGRKYLEQLLGQVTKTNRPYEEQNMFEKASKILKGEEVYR